MAADTTAPKKRKPQGPRGPAKPKIIYLLYKGNFESPPVVEMDGGVALVDRMIADRDLKVEKITLPVRERKARVPAAGAATA